MNYTNIYILINPITNEIRYVGKANNVKERFKNHKNRCRDTNTYKRHWINKLRLKGLYPELEVIDIVPISEWHYWEKFWISYFKSIGCRLTNTTSGGDGSVCGNKTSFKPGHTPWNKGTAKPVIKKGFNKKCLETAFKKGHIGWNKGLKGIKLKPNKNVYQYCPYTGNYIKSWNTAREASIELNINEEGIGQCARGKAKSAGKYIWSYTFYKQIEIKNNYKLKIKKHDNFIIGV
jgi:hypothetical protein